MLSVPSATPANPPSGASMRRLSATIHSPVLRLTKGRLT